jgi:Asp/Glu/Hydantoin racemase
MVRHVTGGRTVYGQALGVLMLDTVFPRIPGDVGNALTWPFPVRFKVLDGALSSRIMSKEPDETLLEQFVVGAQELEAEGVSAITTSCGFLAVFQRELAAAVRVPVLTSALLQVPMAARMVGPDRVVGILTERPNLTERHFTAVGWSPHETPVVVSALPDDAVFPTVFIDGAVEADVDVLERELVEAAVSLTQTHPEVGAIVLECTNFVPFSQAMRRATGVPVFDLYTLVMQVHGATAGHDFAAQEPIGAAARHS